MSDTALSPDKASIAADISAAEEAAQSLPPAQKLIAEGKIDLLRADLQVADFAAIAQAYAAGTGDLPSAAEIAEKIAAAKAATARQDERVAAVNWVLNAIGKVLHVVA